MALVQGGRYPTFTRLLSQIPAPEGKSVQPFNAKTYRIRKETQYRFTGKRQTSTNNIHKTVTTNRPKRPKSLSWLSCEPLFFLESYPSMGLHRSNVGIHGTYELRGIEKWNRTLANILSKVIEKPQEKTAGTTAKQNWLMRSTKSCTSINLGPVSMRHLFFIHHLDHVMAEIHST